MARRINKRDLAPVLTAASEWLQQCLVGDGSILTTGSLWTPALIEEVRHAFVDHPDYGNDTFVAKLTNQMQPASPKAKKLMAEMLWALLLFPSRMKPKTKRQQICGIWNLSGEELADDNPRLTDAILLGIGSGGPAFTLYRPLELTFLISLVADVKTRPPPERQTILMDYDRFMEWMDVTRPEGDRQFRHMLRYFIFPDRVERISSNNDRRKILDGFGKAPLSVSQGWPDRQLDEVLFKLRTELQVEMPETILDFYEPPLRERWLENQEVKTAEGDVTVVVPEKGDAEPDNIQAKPDDVRQSFQIQAKLAEVGSIMGHKIWLPRSDRKRVAELVSDSARQSILETLPLGYEERALKTIEQIDVIWLKGRAIVRAFEIEHTTAVYSGLLRMADLLTLLPNLSIKLHIVASDERREKVFNEIRRPAFSLFQHGPLARSCTFISYESVNAMRATKQLMYMSEAMVADYAESAEDAEP